MSEDDHAVVVFDRDSRTGTLRQKRGSKGCISQDGAHGCANGTALQGAGSVAVSRDGRNVYVASHGSNAVAVFDRDASGALTQKVGPAGCASDSATRGDCTKAKALLNPQSVTVSRDGRSVYVLSEGSNALTVFDRDPRGRLKLKRGLRGCLSDDGTPYRGASRCVDSAANRRRLKRRRRQPRRQERVRRVSRKRRASRS